jgi:hypothetical protein
MANDNRDRTASSTPATVRSIGAASGEQRSERVPGGDEGLAERAAREAQAAERAATIDELARRNAEIARHTRRGAVGPTGRVALVIGVAAAAALAAGWMVFVALAP